MNASIRLLDDKTEVTGDGYARQTVDISTDFPLVIFGPALEDWGAVTHIEAHDGGRLLYRQTVVNGRVDIDQGSTHSFSIGSIQYGAAP